MASNSITGANKGLRNSIQLKEGVRIRGIYSTALTALLLSKGILIANPSEIIKSRFPEVIDNAIPVVTIKDREDKNGVIILGFSKLFEECTKVIAVIPHVILRKSSIGYYDSVKCKIVAAEGNRYLVEMPGKKTGVLISSQKREVGDYVNAHVIAPLASTPVLREGLAVVGKFARVYDGRGVSFSRFITDYERRALLLSASYKAKEQGLAVRWRSSANNAPLHEILKELDELISEILKLRKIAARYRETAKLRDGEDISEAIFTFYSKMYLDAIRALRVPTVRFHHYIKRAGSEESQYVDLVEELYDCCSLDCVGQQLLKKAQSNVRRARQITLLHEKLSGETIKMKGDIKDISQENVFTIVRTVKSKGIYDGLGLEKRPGDVIYTYICPGLPFVVHEYRSAGGTLKGYYININTPAEVFFLEKEKLNAYVWYVDLEIDIVRLKNEKARIIDAEILSGYCSRRLVGKDLYNYATAVANSLRKHLERHADFEINPINLMRNFTLRTL